MKTIPAPILATLALLAVPGFPSTTQAADAAHGEKLHAGHCTTCHDDGVYTRKERRVDSLSALDAQVRRCDANLEKHWFDEDISDVVAFLNQRYYHFKEKP
jgi:mono/diheme cytochrome c family protein